MEDFTEVVVDQETFKIALLIDVYSQYILGWAISRRATESLVAQPVFQARPWKPAMVNRHSSFCLWITAGSIHLRATSSCPAPVPLSAAMCRPVHPAIQLRGEMRRQRVRNIFYTQWESAPSTTADKEKNLLQRATETTATTVHLLNEIIPRPALGGVTPADVQQGNQQFRQQEIEKYRQMESKKPDPPARSRPIWDVVKRAVRAETMSTKEVLTRLAFFGFRPLRRIAQLNREVWGN